VKYSLFIVKTTVAQRARIFPNLTEYFGSDGAMRRRDVAAAVGITKQALSMIERGQTQPRLDVALAIVKLIPVSLESLKRAPVKRVA
jgi:DNA-binding XRE family transcriptional regulator